MYNIFERASCLSRTLYMRNITYFRIIFLRYFHFWYFGAGPPPFPQIITIIYEKSCMCTIIHEKSCMCSP